MPKTKGEIFKDKKNEKRARVKGGNGKTIATTEGYKNKQSAKDALKIMGISKKNTKDLTKKHQIKTRNNIWN